MLLYKLLETTLFGRWDHSVGEIIGELVVGIAWNKGHVEGGITPRVTGRGRHTSVRTDGWFDSLFDGLVVIRLHRVGG